VFFKTECTKDAEIVSRRGLAEMESRIHNECYHVFNIVSSPFNGTSILRMDTRVRTGMA